MLNSTTEKIYKTEIAFTLSEIENTDDRNTIYMSTWLTKRLAVECHSQTAMRYKNFLVTLDEQHKTEDMNSSVVMVGQIVNQIIPTLTEQLAIQVVPILTETQKQVDRMSTLMKVQADMYSQEREDMKSMIGLRSINVKRLTDKLKLKLNDLYGFTPNAAHHIFQKSKSKVFNKFDILKWGDIPINQYNAVYAFIDEITKDDLGIK